MTEEELEKAILKLFTGEPLPVRTVAQLLGISKTLVCQIEKKALFKLRRLLDEDVYEQMIDLQKEYE